MILTFAESAATAASVGFGCGTTCGTSASAFLSAYIVSEARGIRSAVKHAGGFLLGKITAVAAICAAASALGQAVIDGSGLIGTFSLQRAVYWAQLCIALWLIARWIRGRRGCKACKGCGRKGEASRVLPSFGVGFAYGATPCAPLVLIAGYAVTLPLPEAAALGAVFAVSSSVVPVVLAAGLSGALSGKIGSQLGKALPWFQLAVYIGFLLMAGISLV